MEADQRDPRRPTFTLGRRGLVVAIVGVIAITVPLVIVTRPGPGPGPSQSPIAAASPTPATPAPSPSAPAESWEPLALEPIPAVAALAADVADATGIRPDASFALESLTSEPAAAIADRLEIQPETQVEVVPGADARHVTVKPVAPLAPGLAYRFALRTPDGALAGSWVFRVRAPLRVLGTLPSDRTIGVPITTGIEVTFDQPDAADISTYFSIEPAVAGRFERHGRTQVFVPSRLQQRTAYTVTIGAGLPRSGTDLALEHDVVFRFETAGSADASPRWIVGRDVIETSPSEAPVLGIVAASYDEAAVIPTSADLKVFRFPSESAATAALQAFLAAPRWLEFGGPTLPVEDLPLALSFKATLEVLPDPWSETSNHRVVRFPSKLDPGWYAIEVAGSRPAYAFLQVTRISAWVSVLMDRTIVWVNDVVAHGPIGGATAALPGGTAFGTSRSDGILNAATPKALLPEAVAEDAPAPAAPVLVVRAGGDVLLVAFDASSVDGIYRGEWWENWASGDQTYWSLLFTDRWQYRTTDSVALWGYLRARDDDRVPPSVDIRLVPWASSDLESAPAIASARIKPDASGVFSTKLDLDRAPIGSYVLTAVADGRVVASRYIDVTVIRKPEYQLKLAVGHRAVVTGTSVPLTATATFFDDTPVPDVLLRLWDGEKDFGPTDATGAAEIAWMATIDRDDGNAEDAGLYVAPAGPESGETFANASVLIFPASEHLAATGTVSGGRLRVTGTLRGVDLAAVERQLAVHDWDGDPGGRVIAGRNVSVVVTELIPVRTKTGTRYDFIEKVVVPVYRYSTQRKVLRTTGIVSGADGRVVLDMAVPEPDHQYEVRFSTKDPAGRLVIRTIAVGTEGEDLFWSDEVRFMTAGGAWAGYHPYGVGDELAWTMTANGSTLPSGAPDRYLYIVAQRGLVTVQTTDSPTFRRAFRAADAPGIFVMGVRFTGSTYAPKAAAWADFDTAERRIDVTVTADKARYRPGEDITLRVRTERPDGRPIAADVVLQAVDEKLYAMGAAYTPHALGELYQRVDSGIVRLTSTHQVPTTTGGEGEGGDGGGDGSPRTDFRDMLAFVRLRTSADGLATTTIKASDDLTAWHVAASAMTEDLQAGVGELLIDVGLPLFASVTVADEYLATDRPSIRLRAFGLDLRAGDPVVFTVSSQSLGLAATRVEAKAFADAWLALPTLGLGHQSLDVGVVATTRKDASGKPLTDRLVVGFDVVDSRLTVARTGYGVVGGQLPSVTGAVPATYTFTDAGRGRYLPLLLDLASSTSLRLDRGLAGAMARTMLEDAFGRDPWTLPPDTFDLSRYPIEGPVTTESGEIIEDWQRVGIGLLPYGGVDPWLATRVALANPPGETTRRLADLLSAIRNDPSLPRDLRVAAVAGLAALGESVFDDVAAFRAEADLTAFESIQLGLAAAFLGDDPTARSIERALLEAHGQRLGPWVRLNAASSRDDAAEMTALLAILAARVGDPLAPAMLDYVRANPSGETSHALEAAVTISALLERTPASPTSFAYTVDGKRTVVDIQPGEAVTILLTGPQQATLVLERISGEVGAAVAWREGANVASLVLDQTIGLTRAAPEDASASRLVQVDMEATFTAGALDAGCYTVVEQVPSGLIPIARSMGDSSESIVWPSEVVGQQVTFCVSRGTENRGRSVSLRYLARVVSTGTFAWEPAVMTLDGIPEVVTVTGTSTVRIDR